MAHNESIETEIGEIVLESSDSVEQFIENNQNIILGALGALVLIVGIFIGYKKMIVAPKEKKAESIVYQAQNWFEADSFQLALDGDGVSEGFYEILDNFKVTKTGKMARYYIGISELNLGNYDDAITQLSKFKTSDENVQAVAYGGIGDANAQTGDMAAAAKQYMKAANTATFKSVKSTYLYRAGKVYESLDNLKDAQAAYQAIVTLFPDVNQIGLAPTDQSIAKNAKKSLAKVEAQLN